MENVFEGFQGKEDDQLQFPCSNTGYSVQVENLFEVCMHFGFNGYQLINGHYARNHNTCKTH